MQLQTFRARLIALVLLTSLLTAALVGGTLVVRNHLRLKEMAYTHMLAEADVVALQSSRPLWEGDRETAQRRLSTMAAIRQIGAVGIYDLEGRPFAHFLRDGEEAIDLQPGFGRSPHENWLVIGGMPIEHEGIPVGTLEIAYDLGPINARLQQSIAMGVVIGVLAAAGALLLSLRLQSTLAKPISSLADSAAYIARTQDFSHRAPRHGDDELGMLTDVFNSMLDDIDRSHAERARLLESERSARAEAERATRIKDEFVATLSHELRTPLTAILGWTQMLRRPGAIPPHQAEDALETIERNARLQMRMVEDLLDMSRILSGKLRLDMQPVNLQEVVSAAIATVELAAAAKRIDLARNIDPQAGHVLGDSGRLQQVVWNLLSNAVKFTPEGGRVSISLAPHDGHAIIEVADTGRGIDPRLLGRVFDRFTQADDAENRKHSGLGLGLAIAKQIVELHGGTIRAASKGPGHGSTFTVELPLAPVERQEAATGDHARSRLPL